MKKMFPLLFVFFLSSYLSFGQNIEQILAARDDASLYVENYLSPAMNGLMYNLNNGWYITGRTHKKFGFDITLSVSMAMIPDNEKSFLFNENNYNYLSIQGGGNATLPTVVGGETNLSLEASNNGNTTQINAIDGIGSEWPQDFFIPISIPTPMIQIGMGLPTKTDVKLRFYPKSNTDGIEYSLLGIGVQHNLSQHIKVLDAIPTFTLSGIGAFTQANIAYIPSIDNIDGNQKLEMSINSYTLQAIGDFNLKIINFYLGIGYTGGSTSVISFGRYELDYNGNGSIETDEFVTDPVSLNFGINGFTSTIGTRINLGPIKIFGSYTIQKYPSITAGIAVSIREDKK